MTSEYNKGAISVLECGGFGLGPQNSFEIRFDKAPNPLMGNFTSILTSIACLGWRDPN
jgi:hypothetical protein